MSEEGIPKFRSYQHTRCEHQTAVWGQSFEVVSNPMSSMERTFCPCCGAMFPIDEFVWADTGETISDYYARHSSRATSLQRFLCSKTFMVALILLRCDNNGRNLVPVRQRQRGRSDPDGGLRRDCRRFRGDGGVCVGHREPDQKEGVRRR